MGAGNVSECLLRAANGLPGTNCDEEYCSMWRVADHLGVADATEWSGCAVQHFSLLDGGEEIAAWLLSAKERLDRLALSEDATPPGTD